MFLKFKLIKYNFNKKMELIKRLTFSIIFVFILNGISNACNLTNINIGGNKSEIEKYFGTTEIDIVDPEVDISEVEKNFDEQNEIAAIRDSNTSILETGTEVICPNTDFGNSIFKAYIFEDKIAGVGVEVLNGSNNEESNKKLLHNYVVSTFGSIANNSSDPNWTGSKTWDIGGIQVTYYKILYRENFLLEELQVTNAEYAYHLIDNEPKEDDEEEENDG